jgi:hypothetical protein
MPGPFRRGCARSAVWALAAETAMGAGCGDSYRQPILPIFANMIRGFGRSWSWAGWGHRLPSPDRHGQPKARIMPVRPRPRHDPPSRGHPGGTHKPAWPGDVPVGAPFPARGRTADRPPSRPLACSLPFPPHPHLIGVAGLGSLPNYVVAQAAVPDLGARRFGTRTLRQGPVDRLWCRPSPPALPWRAKGGSTRTNAWAAS